jgi:signal transduction histidine kinase
MSANAQLREREEPFDPTLLRAGVDECPEGLAIVESGRILYANRAFGKTSGLVRDSELRGQLLTDLLPQSTRYIEAEEARFSPGESPGEIEALSSDFQANQRALRVICIRSVKRRNDSGVSGQESRKMEALGRMSVGVAHEFNNLLTAMMLYSDLLMAGLEPGSRLRRHAEAIHKAGADGRSLVHQLMLPSREEEAPMQPVSWNQLVADMASLLTELVGEDIEIETKLLEPLGMVKMDPGQVRRIILNLVLNARYAMPKGGKITLSSRNCAARFANSENKKSRSVPCIEFAVTDTGAGMDKKTLAQVFRPFFTTKPRSQGSGLGLTMVRDIVEKAGGEVQIESELGRGTHVTIRVPRIEVSG